MKKEICFNNVTKYYDENIVAIEGADIRIQSGEFVFLIGKSGSGKSTILKLLSGMTLPTDGIVTVNGVDTRKLKGIQKFMFRRQFGMMEREHGLLMNKTVYDNLMLVLIATEQKRSLRKGMIDYAVKRVEISHKINAMPAELSGGELVRVLLARALILQPPILVLDEPTANLSPDQSLDLMRLLDDINRSGITILVACHSRELVNIMKKRVITLVQGVIVSDEKNGKYDGKKMDIFEERRILKERKERGRNIL